MAQEAEDQRKKKKTKRIFPKAKKPNGFEESEWNFQEPKKPDKEDDKEDEEDNEKDILKKEKNKRKTFEDIFDEKKVSKNLKEVLKDFIDMRKTIKKPMTSKALELLINKLRKISANEQEEIELLNEAIEKSWQTVYPKSSKSAKEVFLSG